MQRSLAAFLAIAGLGLAPACADSDREAACARTEALVGGTRTSSTAWQNVLWHDGGCSALLLSESVVVFAAHCGLPSRFVQGSQLDVELDADAGTLTTHSIDGGRWLEVADCETHPDGEDLAYCTLADSVRTPTVPALLPCERSQVRDDEIATLVGLGFGDDEDPDPGIRRVTRAPIRAAQHAIIIGQEDAGSCRGDSGGPAFVQLRSRESADPIWRALGILSVGRKGECGAADYVDLSTHIPWLEAASGQDLSPCGTTEGDFDPGPHCIVPALDAQGEPSSNEPQRLNSCPGEEPAQQSCPSP